MTRGAIASLCMTVSNKEFMLDYYPGSENNSLYVYYKGLSKQLLTFKFDTVRSVLV